MKNFPSRHSTGFSRSNKTQRGGSYSKPSYGGSRDRDMRPTLHQAECASCHEMCEVPFKPNGRKPVYCGNCFRKEEQGGGGYERKSFTEKRAFSAPVGAACKCKDYGEEIALLNAKLDAILGILTEAVGDEEMVEDEEAK